MAPMLEQDLEEPIKQTIQDLYEIQSSIHGYLGPTTTTPVLIQKIHDLTASLSQLSSLTTSLTSSSLGGGGGGPLLPNNNSPILIPPEIISYVDGGRNPDIYTREFVELVQRSNMFLKGKAEAFAMFRDVLAEEMVKAGVVGAGEVGQVVGVVGGGRVDGRRKGEMMEEEEEGGGGGKEGGGAGRGG